RGSWMGHRQVDHRRRTNLRTASPPEGSGSVATGGAMTAQQVVAEPVDRSTRNRRIAPEGRGSRRNRPSVRRFEKTRTVERLLRPCRGGDAFGRLASTGSAPPALRAALHPWLHSCAPPGRSADRLKPVTTNEG